jgi:phosphoglycerate dehydrogenase-like enzyme
MKIHVVESMEMTPEQKARLNKLGEVKWFDGTPDVDELLKRCEGADVVLFDWAPMDKAIPLLKPGVKMMTIPAMGVGFLPLKEAAAKGIKIANAPGFAKESTGELGIGLMLAATRRICYYECEKGKPLNSPCLFGKTIGIIGAGRIGSYVGRVAEALGMKVVDYKRGGDLLAVLTQSDVVFCALPLSDETKGLLGAKEFAAMKKGAFFVTTSHNKIYDHDALLAALDSHLGGAAIDLEGTDMGDYGSDAYKKLDSHPKIVLTPHIGSYTDYATRVKYDMIIDNVEAFTKGKPINIVN